MVLTWKTSCICLGTFRVVSSKEILSNSCIYTETLSLWHNTAIFRNNQVNAIHVESGQSQLQLFLEKDSWIFENSDPNGKYEHNEKCIPVKLILFLILKLGKKETNLFFNTWVIPQTGGYKYSNKQTKRSKEEQNCLLEELTWPKWKRRFLSTK